MQPFRLSVFRSASPVSCFPAVSRLFPGCPRLSPLFPPPWLPGCSRLFPAVSAVPVVPAALAVPIVSAALAARLFPATSAASAASAVSAVSAVPAIPAVSAVSAALAARLFPAVSGYFRSLRSLRCPGNPGCFGGPSSSSATRHPAPRAAATRRVRSRDASGGSGTVRGACSSRGRSSRRRAAPSSRGRRPAGSARC